MVVPNFLNILCQVFLGLAGLSILVFVHELGHFLVAKWRGVTVLEFAVGFGKVLWEKRINGTRYALRLIPLGGFVRMAGDDPRFLETENNDNDSERNVLEPVYKPESAEERAMLANREGWFLNKSLFSRTLIVLAGPVFNIVFAWILAFSVFYFLGGKDTTNQPIVGELIPDMPAKSAGILAGDKFLSINGKEVKTFKQISKIIKSSKGDKLDIKIERDQKIIDITMSAKPESDEMSLVMGSKKKEFLIGIFPATETVDLGILESLQAATYKTIDAGILAIKSFYWLITGQISAKHVSGPIAIIKHVGDTATTKEIATTCMFLVILSVTLGVLNLLPIPVLDGGHLMLFAMEALKGSPLSLKAQSVLNQIGLAFIFALMIFALGNDLFGILFRS